MLIHSLTIYSWPAALLKEIESWCRNFIWSGNVDVRKLVTVSWSKSCKSLSQGGLGLRSLTYLNEAANLKLCWELKTSNQYWAVLLRSKVFRGRKAVNYHIFSSLWSSVKNENCIIDENCRWLIGSCENINFWLDPWLDNSVASILNLPDHLHPNLSARVSDFINNFQWSFPNTVNAAFPIRASVGGIIRNEDGECLGCFAKFLGAGNAIFAELCAVMSAIEIAVDKG